MRDRIRLVKLYEDMFKVLLTSYIHVKDALKSDQSVVPAGYGDRNVAVIF